MTESRFRSEVPRPAAGPAPGTFAWFLATMLCGAALIFAAESGSALTITSTFDVDAEGWLASGDVVSTTPTHISSGGNPGGAIQVDDQTVGGIWYYDAPAAFQGDLSGAYGQMLSFDLWQTGSGPQFDASDVVLNGAGLILAIDAGDNPMPLDTWVSYSLLLREDAGWVRVTDHRNLVGPPATQGEMLAVLADLTRLRIRGEFITGPDVGRLDNVSVFVVPEAGTALLLVSALVARVARRAGAGRRGRPLGRA